MKKFDKRVWKYWHWRTAAVRSDWQTCYFEVQKFEHKNKKSV